VRDEQQWAQLLYYLNDWSTVSEPDSGGIRVALKGPNGSRLVDIKMTPK
jgi:hypothetical protein